MSSKLYKILQEKNLLGYLELAEEIENTLASNEIYNNTNLVIELLEKSINFWV